MPVVLMGEYQRVDEYFLCQVFVRDSLYLQVERVDYLLVFLVHIRVWCWLGPSESMT